MVSSRSAERLARLGQHFDDLSASLTSPDDAGLDPDRIVLVAARSMPNTEHCALTLLRRGHHPRTLSATDPLPQRVDPVQYETGEGPCLDASEGEVIVMSGAVDADPRWPVFGPRCRAETGVRSMLSVRLSLGGEDHAAMNFYAQDADAFTETDAHLALLIAPFAALSVEQTLRARDSHNLTEALSSSRQIGTAIGILMNRDLITSEAAFERLRETSQHLNRKVRDIAAEVELTGELPEGRPSHADSDSTPGEAPAQR